MIRMFDGSMANGRWYVGNELDPYGGANELFRYCAEEYLGGHGYDQIVAALENPTGPEAAGMPKQEIYGGLVSWLRAWRGHTGDEIVHQNAGLLDEETLERAFQVKGAEMDILEDIVDTWAELFGLEPFDPDTTDPKDQWKERLEPEWHYANRGKNYFHQAMEALHDEKDYAEMVRIVKQAQAEGHDGTVRMLMGQVCLTNPEYQKACHAHSRKVREICYLIETTIPGLKASFMTSNLVERQVMFWWEQPAPPPEQKKLMLDQATSILREHGINSAQDIEDTEYNTHYYHISPDYMEGWLDTE